MDWQTIAIALTGPALAVLGYFLRRAHQEVDEAKDASDAVSTALTNFRIEVAKEYVTHNHLRKIEDSLVRIETKLDAKADK